MPVSILFNTHRPFLFTSSFCLLLYCSLWQNNLYNKLSRVRTIKSQSYEALLPEAIPSKRPFENSPSLIPALRVCCCILLWMSRCYLWHIHARSAEKRNTAKLLLADCSVSTQLLNSVPTVQHNKAARCSLNSHRLTKIKVTVLTSSNTVYVKPVHLSRCRYLFTILFLDITCTL